MDIREAILKAADHIERFPLQFNYWSHDRPDGCGTPGCALGWIGVFAGVANTDVADTCAYIDAVEEKTGISALPFYYAMADLVFGWNEDGISCAMALRLYADKYHPAAKQDLPASVRHIFDMTPGELAEALSA